MHNRLTKANFATRRALYYEASLNKALGEGEVIDISPLGERLAQKQSHAH